MIRSLTNSWRRRGVELHRIDLNTQALAGELAEIRAVISTPVAGPAPHEPVTAEVTARLDRLETLLHQVRTAALRSGEHPALVAATLQALRRTTAYAEAYAPAPLVSVRIGVFKPGRLLFDRALASVRRQTYDRWEAIVVTDGPDAEVAAGIAMLDDNRIRCIQRPRQAPYPEEPHTRWQVAGTPPFNEAISHANGHWIAPIDHDDEWDADHLEVLVDAALRTRAELVYAPCRAQVGNLGQLSFGTWPPAHGDFGFQGAIYHAGIAEFMLYDMTAHITGEPNDWNLARRMLDVGVRFEFVPRDLTTYYVDVGSPRFDRWRLRLEQAQAVRHRVNDP